MTKIEVFKRIEETSEQKKICEQIQSNKSMKTGCEAFVTCDVTP